MRWAWLGAVLAGAMGLAGSAAAQERAQPPIVLRDMGSFHIGGHLVALSGLPAQDVMLTPGGAPTHIDPNGEYVTGQMYVQYFLPQDRRAEVPLLLWHGGAITGVAYETTPDGREGWLNWFVRRGWDTYNSDAVERGRAGWSRSPEIFKGDPIFTTYRSTFEGTRIGAGPGSWDPDPAKRKLLPGSQFPTEAYFEMAERAVPRWTTTDQAIVDAYIAEVDRVCPCVILFHSQAGQFGFRVAQARPDKVRALVAVEPSGFGDPATAGLLKNIPVLMLYGDYIDQVPRWPTIKANGMQWRDQMTAAGVHVDVVNLPDQGIHGNGHNMMVDRNNAEVAGVIQDWLVRQHLAH